MTGGNGNERYDALMKALHAALRNGDVDRALQVDVTVNSLLESTIERAQVDPLAREALESVHWAYVDAIEVGIVLRDQAAVEAAQGRRVRAASGAYRTVGRSSSS